MVAVLASGSKYWTLALAPRSIRIGAGMRMPIGKQIKNLEYTAIIPDIEVGIEVQYLELILSYQSEKGQLVALVNFHVLELKDWLKPFI